MDETSTALRDVAEALEASLLMRRATLRDANLIKRLEALGKRARGAAEALEGSSALEAVAHAQVLTNCTATLADDPVFADTLRADKEFREVHRRAEEAVREEFRRRGADLKEALVTQFLVTSTLGIALAGDVLEDPKVLELRDLARELLSDGQVLVRGSWGAGVSVAALVAACRVGEDLFLAPSMMLPYVHRGLEVTYLRASELAPEVIETLVVLGRESPTMRLKEALEVATELA
jgi:hypothetical protein